jgi:hypothetical protein
MTAAEALLDTIADGLRRWVAERRRSEERLADFVFDERTPGRDPDRPAAPVDWRYYVTRTLALAGDPAVVGLLEGLADGDRSLAELAEPTGSASTRATGRLALVDWIGQLSAAGLVARELGTDRVGLTALGTALLDLVHECERRAAILDGAPTLGDTR